MNRKEMVQARVEKLKKLSDADLVQTIVRYFEKNHTMPGEKAIKDYALSLKGEFDVDAITEGIDKVYVDLAGILDGVEYGVFSDLVKHYSPGVFRF